MAKYKVLTVRQPYASLLVSGIKDVENRSRRMNYRGTVLIHAGAKMHEVMDGIGMKIFLVGASPVDQKIVKMAAEATRNDLFGCIVGSVEIVDCVQDSPSEWAERGQWHWVCRNAKVFTQPIRNVKGRLGLWDWEGSINE